MTHYPNFKNKFMKLDKTTHMGHADKESQSSYVGERNSQVSRPLFPTSTGCLHAFSGLEIGGAEDQRLTAAIVPAVRATDTWRAFMSSPNRVFYIYFLSFLKFISCFHTQTWSVLCAA